jgi:2'-hydroxyisoflavone reductase
MNRRRFIQTSATTSLGVLLSPSFGAFAAVPKKVLVFGGTNFVGPAVVDALLVAGHTVTIFNRGVTNAELFPRAEKLKGFRSVDPKDQDLSALEHRRFDVVIDVWPNEPEIVASAAELLKSRSDHYLFVSSVGAYDRKLFAKPDVITEDAPTQPWNDEHVVPSQADRRCAAPGPLASSIG